MRYVLVAILLLVLAGACWAVPPHHFHFAGPMAQFLAAGKAPGVVSGGLAFAVVLTDAGATITPNPATFTLTAPGWDGTATLTLADAKFAAGHLTATVKLTNGTTSVLEGLRLDLTGATEEYKAKDDKGNDILKTRAQPVTIASPLLLGDVAKKDDADPQPLDASTITFQPETTRITVSGVVSGLYLSSVIKTPEEGGAPCALDFDAQGRLYLLRREEWEVLRCDAEGQNMAVFGTFPDDLVNSPGHLAVNPATGDVLATTHGIYRLDATGAYKGAFPPEGAAEEDKTQGFVGALRFDHNARLYCADEGTLACYVDNRRTWTLDRLGDVAFGSPILLDVDLNGNFWVGDYGAHNLFELGRRGVNGKLIATGPDWHLGAVTSPAAVRCDARGYVYVIEGASTEEGQEEEERVSVFDPAGRLVRVFGHGDRLPLADALLPGQVSSLASDLAFGPDGRVYLANADATQPILVFRPF